MTRTLYAILIALCLALQGGVALAHHGWAWTTGGNIELTGLIKSVRLGNPHGILQVDLDGEIWELEVGQPWRNERAGLEEGDLADGVEIRAIGEPSSDVSKKLLKVERFYIGEQEYVLYPERS